MNIYSLSCQENDVLFQDIWHISEVDFCGCFMIQEQKRHAKELCIYILYTPAAKVDGYAMELDRKVFRWRGEAPTIALLLIIAILVTWTFGTRLVSMGVLKGTALVIVGLIAGLLGGLIGTGGCSVMLPIIHFWMSYPAAIAVGTTLFAVIFTAVSGGYGHVLQRNGLVARAGGGYGATYFVSPSLEDSYGIFEEIWRKIGEKKKDV